ncbi:MAG: ABC transporter [Rickettsiales bacterium]|nr:ABC transporter [Rickettsiales bacterium]OUV52859.1 MAG: hypothetical protein CBC87_05755 [Rickettsiales bacterium TMED127]
MQKFRRIIYRNWKIMLSRVFAMVTRYRILAIGSLPRMLSIFYWPSVQILLWGFFSNYLLSVNSSPTNNAISFLLSAIILWDILFRGQLGLSMTFFEEIWSRNLCHLLITPLRNSELILSLIITSFLRAFLGLLPAILIANYFFEFHLFEMGFYLILFFFNLILMGWSIGLIVCGLVIRYGQSFEELAWAFIFILLPFSCVYYPLDILPEQIQLFCKILPPVYVFEGMREILINNFFSLNLFFKALFLNSIYFFLSILIFNNMLNKAKINGQLFNFGE